jgi:diaminohydroxyphosphoribosylaminopyrimidine deaminase/5-amino-6-(5-phosphoribosylamino)uracil reductase
MREALALAARGLGHTSPNPAVGAVLVRDGKILSSGWHRKAGLPHAEIEALNNLPHPDLARGATLYVTLEPCSSHGKTPPCTDAIIRSGCARVVYGATDPDSRHRGRARSLLEAAGLAVTEGVLEQECSDLNRAWNHWLQTGLPWVILKAGQSLDGRITAPPPRRWITSAASRRDAMKLRAEADAVLVGGATLRTDRPSLTVRDLHGAAQPRRIIWTRNPDALPPDAPPLADENSGETLILSQPDFRELCFHLGRAGIVRLLVEGGGEVHGAAVDSGLVNEVVFYIAPEIFGGGVPTVKGEGAADSAGGLPLEIVEVERTGPDLKIRALVRPAQVVSHATGAS